MKKNILLIIAVLAIGFLTYLVLQKPKTKTVRVPVVMEITVPGIQNTFDPVIMPKPKTVKPRPKLIEEFQQSDDKIKDSLYADAVKERTYDTIYSDTIQDVRVKSIVQGKLLKQEVDYNIFPRMVQIDTFVNYDIKSKNKVWLMLEGGANPWSSKLEPLGKASFILKDKKDRLYSAGIDTQKNIWIGTSIKF